MAFNFSRVSFILREEIGILKLVNLTFDLRSILTLMKLPYDRLASLEFVNLVQLVTLTFDP